MASVYVGKSFVIRNEEEKKKYKCEKVWVKEGAVWVREEDG